MSSKSRIAVVALATLVTGAVTLVPSIAGAAPASGRVVLQRQSPAATPANEVGGVDRSVAIEFNVGLQLRDPAGAVAFERAVSDPASATYRHFLSTAQWEARFSPSESSVSAVSSWLRSQGLSVDGVTPDRMTVKVHGSPGTIELAFGTSLKQYRDRGKLVRLSSAPLTVPASLAGLITDVAGVDQHMTKPSPLGRVSSAATPQTAGQEIPPPPGFRNAPPCSTYYGQLSDTTDPAYGGGFPNPLPYAVCGYLPAQLQSAYGLSSAIASGVDGKGVTVAITDAFASPTLFSDAHEYTVKNQPDAVLGASQFSELVSHSYSSPKRCEASEWFGEQSLDVEAVHAMAPGASILYVGAKNCETALYEAVQQVVDGHLADVITNSWGEPGGDVLESPNVRQAFDNVLLMAAGTGIGVQFSSGDEGDEFFTLGANLTGYPSSSPYATSVGGTSLQIGTGGERLGELGWSTSKSALCTSTLEALGFPGCTSSALGTYLPAAPGEILYGSGGGTSYTYPEPSYQQGVVPQALAERNTAVTGVANRVQPDISMDGDPTTGMLTGETQTFPDGTYYDQHRVGGTSLSSPLLAGVIADADQAAGGPLGFINPLLYKVAASPAANTAFNDIVPAGKQANVRVDYIDEVDAEAGTRTTVRTLDYEGREEFCGKPKKRCSEQEITLHAAAGFDSMTGIGSPGPGLLAALSEG
jgi:subtilase family serine protease